MTKTSGEPLQKNLAAEDGFDVSSSTIPSFPAR
jgi:hypothetical protein